MLDRFTDRARKVMSLAKQEAIDLKSTKVGTEHLLLALAKEEDGSAAEALRAARAAAGSQGVAVAFGTLYAIADLMAAL